MLQFNLFKIPVSVHWMFFLLAAFIGGGLAAKSPQDMIGVFIFIVAAFVSILIHELGHAITGLKLGAPSAQIQLHGLGGMAHFNGARFSRGRSILMTAAGPAASIALAAVSVLAFLLLSDPGGTPDASRGMFMYFLNIMFGINIFWTAINLCPVLPLDGGRIVADLLGPERIKLTCIISFITLAMLAVALWAYTHSLFNMAIMALLGTHTWQVYKQAR